jgi:hypothetical protein
VRPAATSRDRSKRAKPSKPAVGGRQTGISEYGADALCSQELQRHPGPRQWGGGDGGDAVEHLGHGAAVLRAHAHERAERLLLTEAHGPFAEVAHVDDLDAVLFGIARREDLAAARNADRPVGEAVGIVAGPDDEAGTHERGAVTERTERFGFRERLGEAVRVGRPSLQPGVVSGVRSGASTVAGTMLRSRNTERVEMKRY